MEFSDTVMPNNLIEMKSLLLSILLFLMAFMPYIFATAAPAVGGLSAITRVSKSVHIDGSGYGWPLTEICDSNGNF